MDFRGQYSANLACDVGDKMTLIYEWKLAIRKFWSFRLAILSAVLSACELVVQIWQPDGIQPGLFAAIAMFVSLAAGIARIVAQPKAYKE